MYDEDGNRRFSILRMIFICLVIAFFVFLVMWAIARSNQTTSTCTDKSNTVFNNNINYLQEIGTDYFTTDKLPTEVGQTVTKTLEELINEKYILQINDNEGKTCNMSKSYVSVTKTETGYEMKTYLVCGDKEDYVIKVLGCHDLCNNCNTCNSTITEYQYKKTTTSKVTNYTCSKGKLNGKKCTITELVDTKNPTVKTNTTTDTKKANQVVVAGTKTKDDTQINKTKVPLKYVTTTTPDKSEKKCTTTNKTEKYDCNCTTFRNSDGKSVTTCSTCTRTIPVETCQTVVTPGTVTYSCPNGTDEQTGSESNLKCYKYTYTYSCPPKANYSEGSDSNLKCYVVTAGKFEYNCNGYTGYTLSGTNCVKTITTKENVCESGYKLENGKCNKYSTTTINATAKNTDKSETKYKWSTETSLEGWTRTGKTRTVKNAACNK